MTNSVVLTEEMIIAVYDLFDMIGDPNLAIEALVYEHNLSVGHYIALFKVVYSHFLTMETEDLEYELAMSRAHNAMLEVVLEYQKEETARLNAQNALLYLQLEIQQRETKEYFLSQGCSEFVARMKTSMLYAADSNGDDGLELV